MKCGGWSGGQDDGAVDLSALWACLGGVGQVLCVSPANNDRSKLKDDDHSVYDVPELRTNGPPRRSPSMRAA